MVRPHAESDVTANVVESRVEPVTDRGPTKEVNAPLRDEERRGDAVGRDIDAAADPLEILKVCDRGWSRRQFRRNSKPSTASSLCAALAVISSPGRSGRSRSAATEGS